MLRTTRLMSLAKPEPDAGSLCSHFLPHLNIVPGLPVNFPLVVLLPAPHFLLFFHKLLLPRGFVY